MLWLALLVIVLGGAAALLRLRGTPARGGTSSRRSGSRKRRKKGGRGVRCESERPAIRLPPGDEGRPRKLKPSSRRRSSSRPTSAPAPRHKAAS